MGTPKHVDKRLFRTVFAFPGPSGVYHRMNTLSRVEKCCAEGTGTHHLQVVATAVCHVIGKNAVIGATETQKTVEKRRNQNDKQNKQRYLNDQHLPFRVHFIVWRDYTL
jgi:hypothetical protein